MNTEHPKQPSKFFYFVASIPVVIGFIVFAFFIFRFVEQTLSSTDSYTRLLVPGVETIELAAPGDYTIFFEYKSMIDDAVYVAPEGAISGMRCTLYNEKTGEEVPVKPSSSSMHYSIGSRAGTSLLEFTIPEAGRYRIETTLPEQTYPGQKFVIAIGQGFMKDLFKSIGLVFTLMGILFFSIILSSAGIIMVYVRRKRARQP
ncbi:MAG: hypothetical protein ABH871_06410 [Pseudomonadota bacterium]